VAKLRHLSERKHFWGATLFTGLQSGVKLIVNYALGKMAAIYLGPAGLGALGQFQSLVLLVQNFSNGAIQNGVIKYLASAKNEEAQRLLLRTAFTISLVLGLFSGLLAYFLSPLLNDCFLNFESYRLLFALLGASSVFFSLNVLIASLFNAVKDYRSLSFFNMIQSFCSLILFIPLTKLFGLAGALSSVAVFQVLSFVVSWFVFRSGYRRLFGMLQFGWSNATARRLGEYSLMTIFTVSTFSISQLLIRSHLIATGSKTVAGLWEGLNRISNFYLYFIAFLITSHLLPRYAEGGNRSALVQQLKTNLMRMIPLMAVIILLVYFLRNLIIHFVFSEAFLPLSDVMSWHLVGDFLKIIGWIFSNFLVARKYTRSFLITDFIYQASFVAAVYLLCSDLKDVTVAYAICSAFYVALLIPPSLISLKKEFRNA
jgi:PST family polysaccharide transporter